MCRKSMLWGCVLAAFGIGLLIGSWVEGGFLFHCLAFAAVFIGIGMLRCR